VEGVSMKKYNIDCKTKESDISIEMDSTGKNCTLWMKRTGDFSTHHTIEDCFLALTQLAVMVGCCHDEKEYWTILKHIASDKEREVK
jgi:imidazoleglycerol phosphate dehydratase HisB